MLDDGKPSTSDEDIVREAQTRFERSIARLSTSRQRFKEDIKFANGDPVNGYQWPDDIRNRRNTDRAPSLTINKTRQHNLQIINDAKQNKPGVVIRPVGDGASYDAAKVYEGIVRHIEYISNAEQVYDTATSFQVQGGIGYLRVITDYCGEDTFDQEIFLRRVKDPLSVVLDPDINEVDGSDARFAFVFEDVPRDLFLIEFPEHADLGNVSFDPGGWLDHNHIRVAEYYRKVQVKDTLIATEGQDGRTQFIRKSMLDPETLKLVEADPLKRKREVITDKIEWFKIAGNKIIDRSEPLGKYIPIIRVIGEETIIDGEIDIKGHTRSMIDAQRMYNYWTSGATEQVALQGKTPYIAPVEAVEGYMNLWKTANTVNHAVLPYKSLDDQGNPIPRPERQQPPVMATAYVQGMQIAQNEMMMASGQYQSQFGQNENATSGKAINERQRQGDNATYHFIDGLAIAIRFVGKILIDLIPKVYDTPRVVRILAEDGEEQEVQIDPQSPQSMIEEKTPGEDKAAIIFNPNVGKYEVISDVGPSYATQRQEAFNAFSQIVSQNNELIMVIGDLLFKNADFPGADEIAERLKRMIPAHVKGDAPPPDVQALQQQTQQLEQMLGEMVEKLAEKDKQLQDKAVDHDIRGYEAETKRLGMEADAIASLGQALAPLIQETIMNALGDRAGSDVEEFEPMPAMPEMGEAGAGEEQPAIAQA